MLLCLGRCRPRPISIPSFTRGVKDCCIYGSRLKGRFDVMLLCEVPTFAFEDRDWLRRRLISFLEPILFLPEFVQGLVDDQVSS
jgi:hypothetical protein